MHLSLSAQMGGEGGLMPADGGDPSRPFAPGAQSMRVAIWFVNGD